MITKIGFMGRCAALALMIGVTTAAGYAQTRSDTDIEQAVALEKKANTYLDVPDKWSQVARALEQAAQLRGAEDPQAIKDLMFSANVRLQVGDHVRAQQQFVQAAEWALAMGDVEKAAHGFTRAAVIAVELKDVSYAHQLCDRAEKLARSPLLTPSQRDAILRQFVRS